MTDTKRMRLATGVHLPHVPRENLDDIQHRVVHGVEPTPGIEGVVPDKSPDLSPQLTRASTRWVPRSQSASATRIVFDIFIYQLTDTQTIGLFHVYESAID